MLAAGIVGVGRWGQNLVNASAGAENIEFVAGAVRHPEKVADYAAEKGLSLHTSLEAMLDEADIDAVVLATPHSLHVEQMLMAIEAGKHVLSEKPFTLSKADAEKVLDAADAAGVTVVVGHNRRFVPSLAELRRKIADGSFGTLLHVEMTETGPAAITLPKDSWRLQRSEWPAGGMTPMGVHLIDNMVDLFGTVESVTAQAVHRAVEADIDDTTSVLLKFSSGMTGYLAVMVTARPDFVASIYGRDATARMIGRMYDDLEFAPREGEPEQFNYDFGRDTDALTAELDAFGAAAMGQEAYPVSRDEIIHVVAVLEAVIKSAASGGEVKVA
ncbi:MAG: Gfo/Idh/MocA family oxidoreductase [Proteobacteria bacterium]|nr:Gfo/Idh/MocA family oxidoreductase [Pseudomonadota bacterium]